MDNIYVIRAEYGQWEDSESVELYVATNETDARNALQSITDQISAAYAHLVEGMCHGIHPHHENSLDGLTGNEHIASIASNTYYDGGVYVAMYSMPVGHTFYNSNYVDGKRLSFFPEGWDKNRIEKEGEEFLASKYEQLAEPYEHKFRA